MSALTGIRVLDLTKRLPGPFCSLMLADYGADVIKIEDPDIGDNSRYGKPFIQGVGARYLMLNRNKKSIAIDLKKSEGKEIFRKMAEKADVIIEGFRPEVMDRLGLSYKEISKTNPKIIYCSLSGYGQNGPYHKMAGHDVNYIGYSGVLGLIGMRGDKPVIPGVQIADIGGGSMMALSGIMMALFHRERTGKGQYIDISMLDGAISWLYGAAAEYFVTGETQERGNARLNGKYACYDVYSTKDGRYLSVGALEDKFWSKLCTRVGRPEWISLKDVDEEQARLRNELQELFLQKDQKEWLELLEKEDTCVGPVYDLEEVFSDPHVLERGMVLEMEHPIAGNTKQIGFPIKFSSTKGELRLHAPELGENTLELLLEMNYQKEDIDKFIREGIITSR
jgi:crotonobetainyl-CoA:carnitine CoA-transferase CaiB-like acyl-CoA transferase